MVEGAEDALSRLGYQGARVRHHGNLARIEFRGDDLEQALTQREEITASLKDLGYTYVVMDLEGYRMGSMNEVLPGSSG